MNTERGKRLKKEPTAPGYHDTALPLSFAQCPNCACQFEDIRIMSMRQFAANLSVTLVTVRFWMQTGKLKFRIWARYGRPVRVILAQDARAFLDAHLGNPEAPDDRYSMRLWHSFQQAGAKGWAKRKENAKAKKDAVIA